MSPAPWDLQQRVDELEEALQWIADHSQEFTQEIHGYAGYGQALAAVHNRARDAIEPRERP